MMKENKKGWINVIGAMIILGTVYGCVINCFTLFVVPVSNERGIDREYVSLILTIMFLSFMVSSSLSGKVYEKIRLKRAIIVSAILVPLFYYSLSFNMYSYQLLDDATVLESSVQEHQVLAILLVIED